VRQVLELAAVNWRHLANTSAFVLYQFLSAFVAEKKYDKKVDDLSMSVFAFTLLHIKFVNETRRFVKAYRRRFTR